MSSKQYKNPPITEAVFEVFFTTQKWSPIVAGQFYEEVKSEFPNISQNTGAGIGIAFDVQGFQIGPSTTDLIQYRNGDGSTLIQLSNGLMTVNKLPRYSGWESYKEVILKAFTALNKVIEIASISRVGLRAINKIDVKNHSYKNFTDTFKIYPTVPEGILANDMNSIQVNIETPIIADTEILALSLITLRKEGSLSAPVMLQLYYTRIKDNQEVKIDDWLETAHIALHKAFEAAITEQRKKEFDE